MEALNGMGHISSLIFLLPLPLSNLSNPKFRDVFETHSIQSSPLLYTAFFQNTAQGGQIRQSGSFLYLTSSEIQRSIFKILQWSLKQISCPSTVRWGKRQLLNPLNYKTGLRKPKTDSWGPRITRFSPIIRLHNLNAKYANHPSESPFKTVFSLYLVISLSSLDSPPQKESWNLV